MAKTVHDTVRGKTIALEEDLGVADGQEVEVRVKAVKSGNEWGKASSARPERWRMTFIGMR